MKLNCSFLMHIAVVSVNLYYGILHEAFMEENIHVKIEQQNIARMLDQTPKQWELIKQGFMGQII